KTLKPPRPPPPQLQSTAKDELEDELKHLELLKKEAEERRRLEDEEIQQRIKLLEIKKQEEDERNRQEQERLRKEEEEKERQRLLAEEERRRNEEEERKRKEEEEKEKQEAEKRRIENERRRKRLEEMRRKVEEDNEDDSNKSSKIDLPEITLPSLQIDVDKSSNIENNQHHNDQLKLKTIEKNEISCPRSENFGVEPDILASIKDRPTDLAVSVASPEIMPAPIAPPRRRKKKKQIFDDGDTSSVASMEMETPAEEQSTTQSIGLPVCDRPPSEILTPTTTIESITKELEHSLDLVAATKGDSVVLHQDLEQIKGQSRVDVEGDNTSNIEKPSSETKVEVDAGDETGVTELGDGDNEFHQRLLMKGRTETGKLLSDEEVLSKVMVTNLDTGEQIPLAEAEDKLPKCVNPLVLHIMRITSEYVRFKIKRMIGKTVNKTVNKIKEVTKHEDSSSSEDEAMPIDNRFIKVKACSHNKGPYDFDQIIMAQDLSGDHVGAVWTMKFSYCGRLLATAGQDTILRIWVLKDNYSYFDDMRQKYNSESRVSPSPSQESVNSITSDSRDSENTPESTLEMDHNEASVFAKRPFCTYAGHTGDVLDVSWSKNYFILSSSMDKTVRLWHISRRECLCCFQHIDFVTAIAFHPRDDRYFLSGSLDGKLRLWNIPDKKVALWNEVDGQTKLITAANFCQNGKFAVVGTYDGRCIFYDTEHLKYFTQIHVRSTRGKNAKGRKITGIDPLPGQDK
uniref:WD repeat-containing protein 44 n=1 Tax=Saccoglossus kowalevskii TaxID=10224 RepID=A0ABM0MX39_SACKO